MTEKIDVKTSALSANDKVAAENRAFFAEKGLTVLNLVSSPGSGKTSLLEAMAKRLGQALAVITGDIQMTYDADRVRDAGSRAVQIETHGTCHLTAAMVQGKLGELNLKGIKLLVIENIGNLVCPSTYDLGESLKVALLSVAEGDEKPMKYPALFLRAGAVVFTKTDLLPYVDFDLERAKADCLKLNPKTRFFSTSCKTAAGLEEWFSFLQTLPTKPR
jgi:hydrogenase nickel incorporation protein HypB